MSASGRTYLDVPYAQKERAKSAGARWDPKGRRWYAVGELGSLTVWLPLPEPLPGEDRSFGSGLFVDLVPSSCWFTNIRTCVEPDDWDRLRRYTYARAGHRCEVCGVGGVRLEAHERWEYDVDLLVQSLRRLICLCHECHLVTHFGRAELIGEGEAAYAHLRSVTGYSRADAAEHVETAYEVWALRSQFEWELDLSVIESVGITVVAPETAERP